MLKSFYYKNRFSNSKNQLFSIIEFPCITITTGVHNFMQVKMYMICVAVAVMKNEYIHVCAHMLKSLTFHYTSHMLKMMQNFKPLVYIFKSVTM